MPTYEYQCKVCSHQFEIIKKMSDNSPTECPACHKMDVERLISAPNIQFKGTGWYVTDYKNKDKKPAGNASESQQNDKASSTANSESKQSASETKSTESKSNTEK